MKELDEIFDEIDGRGKFQRILLYFVFGPVFAFLPLAWSGQFLLLSVPDHWCYHQMSKNLNETELLSWKECYLPKASINGSYEKCRIYLPLEDEGSFWNETSFNTCPWNNLVYEDSVESQTGIFKTLREAYGGFNHSVKFLVCVGKCPL